MTTWDDLVAKAPPDFVERIEAAGPGDCWSWKGHWRYGRTSPVRALARFILGRSLSPTEHVAHICLEERCVNPAHLELVRPDELVRRHSGQPMTCPWGHPLPASPTEDGVVQCPDCAGERAMAKVRARRNHYVRKRDKTRIGWLINRSGMPLYWWAAEARIAQQRLSQIANGTILPSASDLERLRYAFNRWGIEADHEDLVGEP